MSPDQVAARVAATIRHTASPEVFLLQLEEAAESARNAVAELRRDLSTERAERLAIHFGGMQRHAMSLVEALKRQAQQ